MDDWSWWQPVEVPEGSAARLSLGTLWLEVRNIGLEWHVIAISGERGTNFGVSLEVPVEPDDPPAEAQRVRYGVGRTGRRLRLSPRLADAPVIARPDDPYVVAPGGESVLHVSHPVMVEIRVGEGAGVVLCEVPSRSPRRTWFGSPTRGTLCYALATSLRQRVEELDHAPYRAVTEVTVRNEAPSPLPLERLRLPVPALDLYASKGRLWTNPVRLSRKDGGDEAELRVRDELPHPEAQRIGEAREEGGDRLVERAFNAFFSGGWG